MNKLTTNVSGLKQALENDLIKNKINEVVGKNAAAFATSLVQIASQNEMLSKAEPNSIIGAALTAATLNLPLNNSIGQAYIVPFNEKQKNGTFLVKAQFILGYKGLKQLATRSGEFKFMHSTDVREGEVEFHDRLSGEIIFNWIQDEKEREKKRIVGYVSYFELVNGFKSFRYMTIEELGVHGKKYSQTFKKGFGLWVDDNDKMCKKTVTKLHLNNGEAPLSIEMQRGIQTDQSIIGMSENEGEIVEEITYSDNEVVKVDPDKERALDFIKLADTQEELDMARDSKYAEEFLPEIKAKQKELNLKAKK